MDQLPHDLTDGLEIAGIRPVSGGDIARAYRVDTPGGSLFCKTHPNPRPNMFEREAAGLEALRAHAPAGIHVPRVLRSSASGLLLEWIDESGRRPDRAQEEDLGTGLAQLHRTTHDTFGGLDTAPGGYLGSVGIDMSPTPDWPDFFLERRLRPLMRRGIEDGVLDPVAQSLLDRLAPRVAELCGPPEPPALVHGDLWAGNRLVDREGATWLIDPAVHWAHREVDLAMMQLFGGFGARTFTAYDESYPLADGWRERTQWYQLPPLLVHAILFGGGYGDAAVAALRRYA